MANNRMWLVHKGTGRKILLAKYYPKQSGPHGWYEFCEPEELDSFFDTIQATAEGFDWLWGPVDFELEFEQLPEKPRGQDHPDE